MECDVKAFAALMQPNIISVERPIASSMVERGVQSPPLMKTKGRMGLPAANRARKTSSKNTLQ